MSKKLAKDFQISFAVQLQLQTHSRVLSFSSSQHFGGDKQSLGILLVRFCCFYYFLVLAPILAARKIMNWVFRNRFEIPPKTKINNKQIPLFFTPTRNYIFASLIANKLEDASTRGLSFSSSPHIGRIITVDGIENVLQALIQQTCFKTHPTKVS